MADVQGHRGCDDPAPAHAERRAPALPELGRPVLGPRAPVTLAPWHLPTLLLAPGEAAQLLGELYAPGKPFLPTQLPEEGPVDVPYGASLRWLTAVHDLAWRLVGRGQVRPALTTEAGRPYARWRPVPDADGWRRTRELTAPPRRSPGPSVPTATRTGGRRPNWSPTSWTSWPTARPARCWRTARRCCAPAAPAP